MTNAPKPLLLAAVVFLMACPALHAQNTIAHISVEVVDYSGAVIPGAQVKAVPLSHLKPEHQETEQDGRCSLNLPPGSYNLFVSSRGFLPWTENLQVRDARNQTVRIILQVAPTFETVEVPSPPMVETAEETHLTPPPNFERGKLLYELLKWIPVQVVLPVRR